LRPAPYLLALGVVAIGGLRTVGLIKDTLPWAKLEGARHQTTDAAPSKPQSPEAGVVHELA
jgi:hypothetical protein